MLLNVTDRELSTMLAALRLWQLPLGTVAGPNHELMGIATSGGEVESLDAPEVDELCERLNCPPVPAAMTIEQRHGACRELEKEMNRHGCHIAFSVNVEDVREEFENDDGSPLDFALAGELAAEAARDLFHNEMDHMPLSAAIVHAWREKADEMDDDGCPHGDPGCLSGNGDCHDACDRPHRSAP